MVRSWNAYRERKHKRKLGSDFKSSINMCSVRIDSGEKRNGTQIEAKGGLNICKCSVILRNNREQNT